MIVGTNLNEFVTNINHPDGERMTEPEMLAKGISLRGATVCI